MPVWCSKKLRSKKYFGKKFYTLKNISEKNFSGIFFLRPNIKLSLRLLIKIPIYVIKNIISDL